MSGLLGTTFLLSWPVGIAMSGSGWKYSECRLVLAEEMASLLPN